MSRSATPWHGQLTERSSRDLCGVFDEDQAVDIRDAIRQVGQDDCDEARDMEGRFE